jgi:radical SAM superfamily enzyme YgiQ (UPF0313 family)
MIKFLAPKLNAIYQDNSIYSQSILLSSPPAETQPNVLVLELTSGCNYGKCTYCDLYADSRFKSKTLDEFKGQTQAIIHRL